MVWRGGSHGTLARGRARQKATSIARWQRIVQYSMEGQSKADVAEALGIQINSLDRYLKEKTGSKLWPVASEHHPVTSRSRLQA